MKTRFDESKVWVTGMGEVVEIREMETTHLMNTIRMFVQKPYISMGIIIKDIERNMVCCAIGQAWQPVIKSTHDVKRESISNVTSMSEQEIIDYTLDSPLGKAMLEELESRGVNIENFLDMVMNGGGSF